VLVPAKKAEKGYVLLRETLAGSGRIGIARVVVRTREYLSAVIPDGDALMLMLLRYPQELVDVADYAIPSGKPSEYRVTQKEIAMARQLVESMAGEWKPDDYHDEFRERLHKVIEKRVKSHRKTVEAGPEASEAPKEAATNVVDFMSLLEKSLKQKKRTPAKKKATKKKGAAKKAARKAK
jgi:DNA end-binding protein Ku